MGYELCTGKACGPHRPSRLDFALTRAPRHEEVHRSSPIHFAMVRESVHWKFANFFQPPGRDWGPTLA